MDATVQRAFLAVLACVAVQVQVSTNGFDCRHTYMSVLPFVAYILGMDEWGLRGKKTNRVFGNPFARLTSTPHTH